MSQACFLCPPNSASKQNGNRPPRNPGIDAICVISSAWDVHQHVPEVSLYCFFAGPAVKAGTCEAAATVQVPKQNGHEDVCPGTPHSGWFPVGLPLKPSKGAVNQDSRLVALWGNLQNPWSFVGVL